MAVLTLAAPNIVDGQPFASLPDALMYLRKKYGSHSDIVKLGGLDIQGDNEWRPAIENRLREFLDDLGNCPLDAWMGALHSISHGDLLSRCPNSGSLRNAYAGKPAICLAAGPTASQHMDWIKEIQGSHYIFTCDSMLDGCLEHGITPDYVCMIEREQRMSQFVGRGKCGSYLLAPPVIHPDCTKSFGSNVLWWWGADELYYWLGEVDRSPMGRSAGTLSVAAALWAGCNPIYLVGHDLGYALGRSHAPATHALARDIQAVDDAKDSLGNYYLDQFDIPKNGGGMVRSNGLWSLFKGDIETMVAQHPERTVYNANTTEGAVITGTIAGGIPAHGPLKPTKTWEIPSISDPKTRIPSILADLDSLQAACQSAMKRLCNNPNRDDLAAIAHDIAISKLVSMENAWLFGYVARPLYSGQALRLHLRASQGADRAHSEMMAQCSLVECLFKVADRMRKDLQCLKA